MPTKDCDLRIKFFVMAIAIVTVVVLDGCASLWQQVEGRAQATHCSIQMPPGWMRLSTNAYEMVSKDGPYLQYILLNEQPVTQGFQYTRQKVRADMLPNELAEVVIANLRGDPSVGRLRLIDNEPALVCGADGFKLVFTFKDQFGVDMRTLYYGVMTASTMISLRYNAAQRYYFEAALPAFEAAFQSLRLSNYSSVR